MNSSLSLHRRQMGVWALLAWAGAARAQSADTTLPAATVLREALAAALKKKQPLVVMVSLEGCPYCRVARQSYLAPMHKSGVEVVQLDMNSAQLVQDFAGQATTHGQLIRHWRVTVAPTVLFFGPNGKEVAERLEGASLPDFYGAYLEQRLEKGRQSL